MVSFYWNLPFFNLFHLIFLNSLFENINSTTIKYLELWGNVESDGKWNGLVRLAKDGTVDFVMCDLMHTYSRSQVNIYTATRVSNLFDPY